MFKRSILALAVSLPALTAANASDLPSRKTPPAYVPQTAYTWSGFYFGGSVGHNYLNSKLSATDGINVDDNRIASDGAAFGLDLGYNYQIGALVLGAETDITLTTNRKTNDTIGFSERMTSIGTVRARLGYAVDRTLFYVTGGLAYGQAKATDNGTDPIVGINNGAFETKKTRFGYALGGGVEYAMTNNITLKAESIYVNFGKRAFGSLAAPQAQVDTLKSTDVLSHIGMNYKF